MKILVTCPPMLNIVDRYLPALTANGVEVTAPEVLQTLRIEELAETVPQHDGWIIGDDPVTREVLIAGKSGRLRAAVKWGIGVDNVDQSTCRELNISFENTPRMFGAEVADIALGYLTALARETHFVDREVRAGKWPKPAGISLAGKTVALVGLGDIGKNIWRRLSAADMHVICYDPYAAADASPSGSDWAIWPERIEEADFLILCCALTDTNVRMLNHETLAKVKRGIRIINVSRGQLIDETSLVAALRTGCVHSAALDVFEVEPLPQDSYLRTHPKCILGSHNASNTIEAVVRTSDLALEKLLKLLGSNLKIHELDLVDTTYS